MATAVVKAKSPPILSMSKQQATHKPKPTSSKVRFSALPPPYATMRQQSQQLSQDSTSRSSTRITRPGASTSGPSSVSTMLLVTQLLEPSINTRTSFEIAYEISKSSQSTAAKNLATVLCRDDIAETTSRLSQNRTELDEVIKAAQQQVEKFKKMEKSWRPSLPTSTRDYIQILDSNYKAIRESVKYFEELRAEYEKVISYLNWIERLKAERNDLLDDQKFMNGHVLQMQPFVGSILV